MRPTSARLHAWIGRRTAVLSWCVAACVFAHWSPSQSPIVDWRSGRPCDCDLAVGPADSSAVSGSFVLHIRGGVRPAQMRWPDVPLRERGRGQQADSRELACTSGFRVLTQRSGTSAAARCTVPRCPCHTTSACRLVRRCHSCDDTRSARIRQPCSCSCPRTERRVLYGGFTPRQGGAMWPSCSPFWCV